MAGPCSFVSSNRWICPHCAWSAMGYWGDMESIGISKSCWTPHELLVSAQKMPIAVIIHSMIDCLCVYEFRVKYYFKNN